MTYYGGAVISKTFEDKLNPSHFLALTNDGEHSLAWLSDSYIHQSIFLSKQFRLEIVMRRY